MHVAPKPKDILGLTSIGTYSVLARTNNVSNRNFAEEYKRSIKIDQLMSLVLLFHYLLLNMFRMLVHSSSGACDLLWIYFMCCIALVRCVLVLGRGSAGVVWYPYAG